MNFLDLGFFEDSKQELLIGLFVFKGVMFGHAEFFEIENCPFEESFVKV